MPPKKKKGKAIALSSEDLEPLPKLGETSQKQIVLGKPSLQIGSSAQTNQKLASSSQILGSSTQQIVPSTQNQKISPLLMKIEDYTLPIETLQGLAQASQSLSKLPRRSWADIADEEAQQNQLNLAIRKKAQEVTKAGQNSKQMVLPSPNFPKSNFITKPDQIQNLFITETGFWNKDPFVLAKKLFPPGFFFKPLAITKTQKFYEFILVATNSAEIRHFPDPKYPNDRNIYGYTTFKIKRVLSPKDWGQDLDKRLVPKGTITGIIWMPGIIPFGTKILKIAIHGYSCSK